MRALPAYDFSSPQTLNMQSVRVPNNAHYQGTTYKAFNDAPPSAYTAQTIEESCAIHRPGSIGKSRRIGNFDNIPEGGTQENMSPIGEPWLLALFAALFAGIITWKKRTFHGTITGPSPENNPK